MHHQQVQDNGNAASHDKRTPLEHYDSALKSFESGRLDAAEEGCRKALSANPAHADSLHLLGAICAATNRLDLGIDLMAQAVRNDPTNPEYFSNLGTLLQRQGRFDEAFKSYDLALKLKPESASVWIKLGDLLKKQGRVDEALLAYDHAFSLDEQSVEAANKSGQMLRDLQRYEEALARFRQCLEISSQNLNVHNDLGVVLIDLHRPEEALPHLQAVLKIKPDDVSAIGNLGVALTDLKRFDEALAEVDRGLAISSGSAKLFNNRANALKGLGRHSDALVAYDRAIALNGNYTQAHYNRGVCLGEMMRHEDALASYRGALAVDPNHASAHWNLAVNRLLAGDFKTGWVEAEWRWKCEHLQLKERLFKQPLWLGREPIEGKTMVLYNDQGLGDALQFCRYVPLVAARGANIILEVDQPLRALLSGLKGISRIVATGEALPDFDYHCPLFSLPLAFDTTLDTIPSEIPYVSVVDSATDWQAWLGERKKPRIGLVWSGNPKHGNDSNRSIALETLLPLLDVDAQFVSLQKDLRTSDAAILCERSDILDANSELKSFSDTATLLGHLDLLITVDTSVAHLAGALGRPAWVLLPRLPDWRWMLDREDNPWYPSLRLFRQTETATWPPVVQRVKEALQEFVAGGEPSIVRALV
jgi:tetratricopeptide (TPR) repeat protein